MEAGVLDAVEQQVLTGDGTGENFDGVSGSPFLRPRMRAISVVMASRQQDRTRSIAASHPLYAMPNWYANTLLVLGPSADVQRFRKAVLQVRWCRQGPSDFSLNQLAPVAATYRGRLAAWGAVRARLVTETRMD